MHPVHPVQYRGDTHTHTQKDRIAATAAAELTCFTVIMKLKSAARSLP
uniref:Uncharacterized protein n=1 Tax=Anguilla anguilla TaxID=7936 RepID=A0A0E9X2G7_ANGAN